MPEKGAEETNVPGEKEVDAVVEMKNYSCGSIPDRNLGR